MDIVLPGIDGYEVAARLREYGVKAPIIAITSLADDPVKRKQCGIDEYIDKPVSFDRLKALLDRRSSAQTPA